MYIAYALHAINKGLYDNLVILRTQIQNQVLLNQVVTGHTFTI